MEETMHRDLLQLDTRAQQQIQICHALLQELLGPDLLGIYLYGSALLGGLQKYSDLDLFVVSNRPTTAEEKRTLVTSLLTISGNCTEGAPPPIEMTIVERSQVSPWRYPPLFDFQYGEWLREDFERGNIEPWKDKSMPDLAVLISQVLLCNKTIAGKTAHQTLSPVPYQDFLAATLDSLPDLLTSLATDTRNVILTLARVWSTVETTSIRSKPDAATWALCRLPKTYRPVIQRAYDICIGKEEEHWDDIQELLGPCASFMANRSTDTIKTLLSQELNTSLALA